MKKFLVATTVAGLLVAPGFAQDRIVEIESEATISVSESPGRAQDSESDTSELIEDVTNIAQGLQDRIETLGAQMADATDPEAGTKVLDEMLAAAREVYESLNRDSELWDEMNGLMDIWAARRDDLLERASDNPALKQLADGWQARIDRGLTLRQQIIEQSAESEALIAQIEAQREVVLEYFKLDLADEALATMQSMSDELGSMNERMSGILSQANLVAEAPGIAQE